MTREEVGWQLRKIIAKVAGLSILELADDQVLREELLLDSLKELEIVARTEVQFGIELDEGELAGIRTLQDYCNLVMDALDSARAKSGR